jgi:hypothetical protein
MATRRDPQRLLAHALAAGDRRLVALIAARLHPAARRTLLALRERLGI